MTTINVGTDFRSRGRATNNGWAEFIRGPELPRLNILPGHECVGRYFSISPPIFTINCLVSPLISFVGRLASPAAAEIRKKVANKHKEHWDMISNTNNRWNVESSLGNVY